MRTRPLALLITFGAIAVSAQGPDDARSSPPLVPREPPPSCAPCAQGALCIEGVCQFTCDADVACRWGRVCVIKAGEKSGVCEPAPRPGAAAAWSSLLGGAAPDWEHRSDRPVPPGFRVMEEPRWESIVVGLATFSLGYLPMAAVALDDRPVLAVPLVGPILNYRPAPRGGFIDLSALDNLFHIIGIVVDVAVQAAGLGAIVNGLVSRKRTLVRDADTPRLRVVPATQGASLGASVVGRF